MTKEYTEAFARNEIMRLLKNEPSGFTDMMMSRKLKIGLPALRLVLENMDKDKIIRKEPLGKCRRYYLPTERELAAEQAAKPVFKILKPRLEHRAVMDKVRSERNQYASIG
jgi:predicted transcriptional regulator